jgi:hypothetical protein
MRDRMYHEPYERVTGTAMYRARGQESGISTIRHIYRLWELLSTVPL